MASRKRVFLFAAVGLGTVWSYSRRAVRRWEDLDLAAATKPGQTVEVDGVHLHYVEAGSGPTLLLLHGLNGSTFSFRLLMPYLTPHFRDDSARPHGIRLLRPAASTANTRSGRRHGSSPASSTPSASKRRPCSATRWEAP